MIRRKGVVESRARERGSRHPGWFADSLLCYLVFDTVAESQPTVSQTMKPLDTPLLIIASLLFTTLLAFFLGLIHYPYGSLVLLFLLLFRLHQLRSKGGRTE